MKSVLLLFAMTMTTIAGAVVAKAQTATAEEQTPFWFELSQADGPRGLGVEGYVHNGLPWRITNARLRVADRARPAQRVRGFTFDPSPSSGRRTLLARPPRMLREAGSR
jgi:hypothetical protein